MDSFSHTTLSVSKARQTKRSSASWFFLTGDKPSEVVNIFLRPLPSRDIQLNFVFAGTKIEKTTDLSNKVMYKIFGFSKVLKEIIVKKN